MPTRRDQVEAYSFAAGRLRSALVRAEPDAPRPPMRRTPIGLIIGVVLALLALGGVALLALLSPGSAPGWQQPGALIIEKETGNRYILVDGRLHPVLNYASARLLLPDSFTTVAVSAEDLASVPHGGRLGIEGAPDLLPTSPSGRTWLICATTTTAVDGQITPRVTVLLDPALPEQPLPEQPLPEQALPELPLSGANDSVGALVTGPDGTRYLIHDALRMKITADWVITALGYAAVPLIPVTATWLDAIPPGPDLSPIPVSGRGTAAPGPDTFTVGMVLVSTAPGPPEQYFLVTEGGLVPVNETTVALIMGDPQAEKAYGGASARPIPVDVSVLSRARLRDGASLAQPPVLPRTLTAWNAKVPCLRLDAAHQTINYTLVMVAQPAAQAPPIEEPGTAAGQDAADGFAAAPGGGALVRTLPAPGANGLGLYLVVETGAKYPLADAAAATALGYSPATAAPVPAALLGLLPSGPELRILGGDG